MVIKIQRLFKFNSILLLPLLMIIGCAASHVTPKQSPDSEARKQAVDQTVYAFLEALKNKDYQKAHGYVFMPDMNESEYVDTLKQAQDRYQSTILGYKILDTHVLTKSALVDVELELSYKPDGSQELLHKKQILRYELTEIKEWRITKEICISNCGNGA